VDPVPDSMLLRKFGSSGIELGNSVPAARVVFIQTPKKENSSTLVAIWLKHYECLSCEDGGIQGQLHFTQCEICYAVIFWMWAPSVVARSTSTERRILLAGVLNQTGHIASLHHLQTKFHLMEYEIAMNLNEEWCLLGCYAVWLL
jgi:hypothetical protein